MKKRIIITLAASILLTVSAPALAAQVPTEQETAAASLQAQGLMAGDENGDLHLDASLTRAQMAVLVSQLCINPEHIAWERGFYSRLCDANFTDVPEWAKPYVGVCAANGIIAGYGDGRFAPADPVSPQMACTVILSWLERDGWDYATACDKALELELAPAEALEGDTITRGDMALLICRAQDFMAWLQTL